MPWKKCNSSKNRLLSEIVFLTCHASRMGFPRSTLEEACLLLRRHPASRSVQHTPSIFELALWYFVFFGWVMFDLDGAVFKPLQALIVHSIGALLMEMLLPWLQTCITDMGWFLVLLGNPALFSPSVLSSLTWSPCGCCCCCYVFWLACT